MRAELMYFCFKNYIGFVDSKHALTVPSLGVYATDHSKTVVLMLFLFCAALSFLPRSVSC